MYFDSYLYLALLLYVYTFTIFFLKELISLSLYDILLYP